MPHFLLFLESHHQPLSFSLGEVNDLPVKLTFIMDLLFQAEISACVSTGADVSGGPAMGNDRCVTSCVDFGVYSALAL